MKVSRSGRLFMAGAVAIACLVSACKTVTPKPLTPIEDGLIWPLCGRLGEHPVGWTEGTACPTATEPQQPDDFPVYHGFGHRNFKEDLDASPPKKFDVSFHRGIDLATRDPDADGRFKVKEADGTWTGVDPVFAVHDGFIQDLKCRKDPMDPTKTLIDDCTLALRIPTKSLNGATPPSAEKMCALDGTGYGPCITALYDHVRQYNDYGNSPQFVHKGAMIAYSGKSGPSDGNFRHLHFELRFHEIRNADPTSDYGPGGGDLEYGYAKDARDPLAYLPWDRPNGQVPKVTGVNKFPWGSGPFEKYSYSIKENDLNTIALPIGVVVTIKAEAAYRMTAVKVRVNLFKIVKVRSERPQLGEKARFYL